MIELTPVDIHIEVHCMFRFIQMCFNPDLGVDESFTPVEILYPTLLNGKGFRCKHASDVQGHDRQNIFFKKGEFSEDPYIVNQPVGLQGKDKGDTASILGALHIDRGKSPRCFQGIDCLHQGDIGEGLPLLESYQVTCKTSQLLLKTRCILDSNPDQGNIRGVLWRSCSGYSGIAISGKRTPQAQRPQYDDH